MISMNARFFQAEIGMRFDKDMHMVVHHDIGVESISLAVKMAKARSDEIAFLVRKIGQPLSETPCHEVERSVSPSVR
jgi:hypothetical protein